MIFYLEKLNEEIKTITNVFDLMEDHVIVTDPGARIVYANNAVYKQTGYSPKDIIGENPGKLWGGQMPKEFYDEMWQRIKVEKKPFIGDVKNKRKGGKEYWQELIVFPILDESNDIKFFVGVEPNIDTRKNIESKGNSGFQAMEKINKFLMAEQLEFIEFRKLLEKIKPQLKNFGYKENH